MFTGIVAGTGRVSDVLTEEGGRRLRIDGDGLLSGCKPGASVSVSGACLTVEENEAGTIEVFLARETLDRTTLGALEPGDVVNLERAMAADGRFDGHLVQGHVDGTTKLTSREQIGEDSWYEFELPGELDRYVVEKGSIALDGVSLTVAARDADRFSVAIVPTTAQLTTFSTLEAGDRLNVEVDVVAKYVEQLAAPYRT